MVQNEVADYGTMASAGVAGMALGAWAISTIDLEVSDLMSTGVLAATGIGLAYGVYEYNLF